MVRKIVGIIALVALTGCTYVEPGYVGIRVNFYGSQKGVEDFPLCTGRVVYNPWTEDIYKYPTFMQNKTWGGDEDPEANLSFNSSEGAKITAPIALNYTLVAEKVPAMFVDFRQPLEVVTDTYLKAQVQNALNRAGGKFKAVDLFGGEKQAMLDAVRDILNERLASRGFNIDSVAFAGSPTADDRVMTSINSVIEATQRAIEAENKVRQVRAEAEQEVEKANGAAAAILTRAKAEAEANVTVSKSITPELIRYEALKKWDGVAPKVLGSDAQMLMSLQ